MLRPALLLASAALALPAFAQDAPALTAEDVAALRAEIRALREEVAALKTQQAQTDAKVQQVATKPSAPMPSWRGAPQQSDSDAGFSFKPKGTIQADAGYVGIPGSTGGTVGPITGTFGAAGVNTNNLGFNSRLRRAIIGAEGSLPGGFGYNVEFELSQASVGYEDVVLTYQKKGSPLKLTMGYHYPLASMELMTSGKFTSFTERAGMNDAFNHNRRLGVSGTWSKGEALLSAGLFNEDIANTNFNRTGWDAAFRGIWMPKLGATQLHLGLNAQHRTTSRDAQNMRYRQRPFTQLTDQRFLDTGRIAADGDDVLGLEFAAIQKGWHVTGEAQKLWVRGYNDPSRVFAANNGTVGASAFLNDDPAFFSGYVEAGLFLTGETRGYKGGRWDRTSVKRPFNKGGWGAVQLNARLDYTDLQDRVGAGAVAPGTLNFVNGGTQSGYGLSAIWMPTDYLRFLAQYQHITVQGGPAAVAAFTSTVPRFDQRDYSTDAMVMRAQVDF
ncbi:MAG TPA: porin [Chakrabartia sp.]|nr:porin [Chakrabartia sp.]